MNKKAQGLSLTTIIVAAIALIVMVVLVMIFTGRIGVFREQFNPNEDVCLEWKFDCYAEQIENVIVLPDENNCNQKHCIDWRPKVSSEYSCQELLKIVTNESIAISKQHEANQFIAKKKCKFYDKLDITKACERGCFFALDINPDDSVLDNNYSNEKVSKAFECIGQCNKEYYWR